MNVNRDRANALGAQMASPPRVAGLLIAVLCVAGYIATLVAFFPAPPPADATYVYSYMQEWKFGDWQSPLMSILWWLIDPIAPGAGSMFLFIATLYWLGFAMVALAAARRSAWIGVAVPI